MIDPRHGRPSPVVITNAPLVYDMPSARVLEHLAFVAAHGLHQGETYRRVLPPESLVGRVRQLERYRQGGYDLYDEREWDAALARGDVRALEGAGAEQARSAHALVMAKCAAQLRQVANQNRIWARRRGVDAELQHQFLVLADGCDDLADELDPPERSDA